MNEKEMIEEIKNDAEKIEVPESLSPENMREKLSNKPVTFSGKKKKGVMKYLIPIAAAAAAFAVVMVAVGPTLFQKNNANSNGQSNTAAGVASVAKNQATPASESKTFNRSDAGTAYRVAKSDNEIKEYIKKLDEERAGDLKYTTDLAVAENADSNVSGAPIAAAGSASAASSHSDTNLMEEGVDESDIVKCDDSHIYRGSDDKVHIVNVEDSDMKELSVIDLSNEKEEAYVNELYLHDDKLIILCNVYEKADLEETPLGEQQSYITGYYWNRDQKSVAFFYDIKDKSAPKFLSRYEQDGYYITSRLVDGKLIIFSNDSSAMTYAMPYIVDDHIVDDSAAVAESVNFDYPNAGGEALTPGDVYLPKDPGSNSFIMGSVSVSDPGKKIDSCMIMSAGGQPYVTKDSIYLYNTNWLYETGKAVTDIARFTYEDGYFNAVSSATVDGSIMDEFAIHEENGNLFVLTSNLDFGRSGDKDNRLIIFDSGLNEIGRLSGIAENERVYAARYIDNIIYFITYRNMDPLFAVDVSDPKNPVMLGSLEITGFSDYLHPWGEGRLLGIGYETDPDSGRTLGTKLLMFDVTDPAKPVIVGEKVTEGAYPYDLSHKAILIDRDENLFGFSVYFEDGSRDLAFSAYSWNEGTKSFEKKAEITDFPDSYFGEIRGLRIADVIYATFDSGIADSKDRVLKF